MKITGGRVFDPEQGFVLRDVYTRNDLICEASADGETVDARGCYVIPGLLDIHFHGCVGEDCSDGDPAGLQKIADHQLSRGVTHICPAGMTLPPEDLERLCRTAAAHRRSSRSGAELVGVHLEGPFLSEAKKGAQNGDYLRYPDPDLLLHLNEVGEGCVRLVTVAPEGPGSGTFIRRATAAGITVSVGHTTADFDTALAAFEAGASHVTHLYNAMPSLHHRNPGVIGAASDCGHVRAEIICDGVHIHPSAVRAAFRLFGRERMILVSDSLRASGMPDGEYPFAGQMITVRGNRATLSHDPNTLAGSVTDLMGCVREAVKMGIPLADAVRAASTNPAAAIGLQDRLGSLAVGKEASLVLLDEADLSLRKIIFKGKAV